MKENYVADPIISPIWLSLSDKTKDSLIIKYKKKTQPNLSALAQMEADAEFGLEVNSILGIKNGFHRDLIENLESLMPLNASGGVFDVIRKHIQDYHTIESAVEKQCCIKIDGVNNRNR